MDLRARCTADPALAPNRRGAKAQAQCISSGTYGDFIQSCARAAVYGKGMQATRPPAAGLFGDYPLTAHRREHRCDPGSGAAFMLPDAARNGDKVGPRFNQSVHIAGVDPANGDARNFK
jgi:hypothetical protein